MIASSPQSLSRRPNRPPTRPDRPPTAHEAVETSDRSSLESTGEDWPRPPIKDLFPIWCATGWHVVDEQEPQAITRHLPQVLAATIVVAVCPVLIVLGLRSAGVASSPLISVPLGVSLSLGAGYAAGAFWSWRASSSDLLFSELMVWGWVRRLVVERRLATALRLLGGVEGTAELSRERRTQLLERLAASLESRDPYTHGHSGRVARTAGIIARGMGLPAAEVDAVRTAAALHDIGKIRTPKAILHKPAPLTDDEYEVIKLHPVQGSEMVAKLDTGLAAVIRHHHERMDGTGYPAGLVGSEIPLGARIIAVADTFDAITSTRPYRAACSQREAIHVLASEAGTRLDPVAVRAFRHYYSGRSQFAVWVILAQVPSRLVSWLGDGVGAAAIGVSGKGDGHLCSDQRSRRDRDPWPARGEDPGQRESRRSDRRRCPG